jgi:Fumarylacetoacetate (FAA) hydrolase family
VRKVSGIKAICPYKPPDVGKCVAIGLNYVGGGGEPAYSEGAACLLESDKRAVRSQRYGYAARVLHQKGDWEVELGIVIGRGASYVEEDKALDHVAGYCIVNDVSEREYQLERGGSWDKGKGFDTFGPVGPWLVTPEGVGDPQALDMWLDVNGERMQTGNTRTMIFSCAALMNYVSREILGAEILKLEQTAKKPSRALGDDDHVRLGDALQARREVRRFTNDAALLRLPRSDQVADDDQPGRNADTSLQQSVTRSAPVPRVPRARRRPHAPADSRSTPGHRRPCISPRTRRSGARSRRHISDKPK